MGYSIHMHPDLGLAVVTLAGRLDGVGLLRAMRALAFDPAWVPGNRVLWDARGLRAVDIGPADLPAFAAVTRELAHRMGPGRSAVLQLDREHAAGLRLLRLRQKGHPGRDLRAFVTEREAAAWLDVPEAALLAPARGPGDPTPAPPEPAPRAGGPVNGTPARFI